MPGSVILRIAYGLEIQPENDPLLDLVERAVVTFLSAASPGKWLVVRTPSSTNCPPWTVFHRILSRR
jgi:hypothetical protein